ncbi:Uncharacterised protein [Mycobacterium tuberculosis]|nr:Uncharacterised protein [Mycobacterium tuberculosis]
MSQSGFQIDARYAPDAAYALFVTATQALGMLCQERGYGPWFDEMRSQMKNGIKGVVFEGLPMEQEKARIDATLTVIDAVFDNIDWGANR